VDRIKSIEIKRGAPCGATWDVLARVIGLPLDEAVSTLAREVQYICYADPSAFDPISGKSPYIRKEILKAWVLFMPDITLLYWI
jgi:hypothetical protein